MQKGSSFSPEIRKKISIATRLGMMMEALECKLIWEISNGRTLCFECHKKTDTYGNRGHVKGVPRK